MDKRLKQMMLDGLFVEQTHNAQIEAEAAESYGFSAEATNVLTDSFIGRIRNCIAEFNENTFLYLGGYISLPKVGDKIPARVDNEDVEYIVDAIDYSNALVETTYLTDETLYFRTTEDATNFATTGNKGTFDNWDRTKSDNYPFVGTAKVTKRKTFSFSDF